MGLELAVSGQQLHLYAFTQNPEQLIEDSVVGLLSESVSEGGEEAVAWGVCFLKSQVGIQANKISPLSDLYP